MTDISAETSQETPISRLEPVAGALHTVFLLVVLGVIGAVDYFSVHRQDAVSHAAAVFLCHDDGAGIASCRLRLREQNREQAA